MNLYDVWPTVIDNQEAAERFAALFLLCGWDYRRSLPMPDYDCSDYLE